MDVLNDSVASGIAGACIGKANIRNIDEAF